MTNDQRDQKGTRRLARGSLGLAIEDLEGDKRRAAVDLSALAPRPARDEDEDEDEDEDDEDDDEADVAAVDAELADYDEDDVADDDGDDDEDGGEADGEELVRTDAGDVPAVSRKIRRRRRRTRPRSKTIAMKRLTREELRLGALMFPPVDDVARPASRAECREEARPCPWVSCKHHLYLDVNPETGSIKINFPDLEPWDMVETCSLDIAERGGITLEEVGEIMNLTRERIRQVEVRGLLKLRMASPSPEEVGAALLRRPGQ